MDGPHDLNFYLRQFSSKELPVPRLHQRSVHVEREHISDYCDSLDSAWRNLVINYAELLPPMRPETRIAALAPARMEESRIGLMLDALGRETGKDPHYRPFSIEVTILENWVHGEKRDDTSEIVKHWANKTCTLFNQNLLHHEFRENEDCRLALARKLLADVTVLRSLRRPAQLGPLYILSEDADIENIEIGRSTCAVRILDDNPSIDALRGPQERSLWAMRKNHLLLIERRSWQFAESLLSHRWLRPGVWRGANFYWNRVVTAGSNVFFSADTYALISGYTPSVRLFEDMDIGQRISVLRGQYNGASDFVPNVDTISRFHHREESSAARVILTLSKNSKLYDDGDARGSFYLFEHERAVRSTSREALLDSIADFSKVSQRNMERFVSVLSSLHNELSRILQDDYRTEHLFRRVMWMLGFQPNHYTIDAQDVNVSDISDFKRRAEHFQVKPTSVLW